MGACCFPYRSAYLQLAISMIVGPCRCATYIQTANSSCGNPLCSSSRTILSPAFAKSSFQTLQALLTNISFERG